MVARTRYEQQIKCRQDSEYKKSRAVGRFAGLLLAVRSLVAASHIGLGKRKCALTRSLIGLCCAGAACRFNWQNVAAHKVRPPEATCTPRVGRSAILRA